MFGSRYMPCPDCGASVDGLGDVHLCDDERRLDYELFQLGQEVRAFEAQLAAYLSTAQGRFAVWYARHRRP